MKIDKLKDIFKKEKNFFVKENNNLDDHGFGSPELGFPLTEITYCKKDPSYYFFDVKFSTNTIKKPIYIYGEGLEEYHRGYQEIEYFTFRLNDDFTKMYIFTSRKLAEPFQKRLEKSKYLSGNNIIFDFSKLKELTGFVSGYGLWKNSQGIVKKAGEFGHGIENTIEDFSVITTLYIDYMYNERQIQLILTNDGRISTQANLENDDLLNIFNEVESTLTKD